MFGPYKKNLGVWEKRARKLLGIKSHADLFSSLMSQTGVHVGHGPVQTLGKYSIVGTRRFFTYLTKRDVRSLQKKSRSTGKESSQISGDQVPRRFVLFTYVSNRSPCRSRPCPDSWRLWQSQLNMPQPCLLF